MIVYPSAFVLSAEADTGQPLNHPRIGYRNAVRGLPASAVTVSGETTGAPRDAMLRPDTWEFWRAPALPATWEVELSESQNIDYVGLAGHNIGSSGAAAKIEWSLTPGVWTTFATEYMPSDDAPLMFLDSPRFAKRLRLTLTGTGAVPYISVFYAEVALAMQRPIYGGHSPITLSRETKLHQMLSRGGQFLGQNFQSFGVRTTAQFQHLTAAWYRANFDPFVKAARAYPYFFAWRPQTFPAEVGYVWSPDDIIPTNMGKRTFMEVKIPMVGIGNE